VLFCRTPFTCTTSGFCRVSPQRTRLQWHEAESPFLMSAAFRRARTWAHWPLVAHTHTHTHTIKCALFLTPREKGMLMERSHFCDPVASPGGRPETGRYMAGLLLWIPDLLVIWERFFNLRFQRRFTRGVALTFPWPTGKSSGGKEEKQHLADSRTRIGFRFNVRLRERGSFPQQPSISLMSRDEKQTHLLLLLTEASERWTRQTRIAPKARSHPHTHTHTQNHVSGERERESADWNQIRSECKCSRE